MQAKPAERPPVLRYVLRDANGFYYDGHGQAPTMVGKEYFEGIGEWGVPGFNSKNILFAIKYGDLESIERMVKNHKIWCIEHNRPELADLLDPPKCEVVETYT